MEFHVQYMEMYYSNQSDGNANTFSIFLTNHVGGGACTDRSAERCPGCCLGSVNSRDSWRAARLTVSLSHGVPVTESLG